MSAVTTATLGKWRGRALTVAHRTACRRHWSVELTPGARGPKAAWLEAWLRERHPALTRFLFTLGLREDVALFIVVAWLAHRCTDDRRAFEWLEELEQMAPERRLGYAEFAWRHAALGIAQTPRAVLREVPGGNPAEYRQYLAAAMAAHQRGVPEELLLAGCRWAKRVEAYLNLNDAHVAATFPAEQLRAVGLAEYHNDWVWHHIAAEPALGAWYEEGWWRRLTLPEQTWMALAGLRVAGRRRDARAGLAALRGAYLSMSEAERRAMEDRMRGCEHRLAEALPFLRRFAEWDVPQHIRHLGATLRLVARPTAEKRERMMAAPEASFQIYWKSQRREGDGDLTQRGLRVLFSHLSDTAVETFCTAPKHLVALAKLLGALHADHAKAILREARLHEFWSTEIVDGDLVALDNLLVRHRELTQRLRRFAEWDLHFSGRKLMPRHGVERAFEELRGQLPLLRLWHVERCLRAVLREDVHTFAMTRSIAHNRRGLRRFLQAEGFAYVDEHPATRRWLERRPGFHVALWRRGVPLRRDGVRIAVERDPREILKMGTYVSSCLAVGSCNAYSAATVLLDINKQVVFARDARGAFVARQLLAISEENKLVCFEIYGDRRYEALFAEHARAVAWALGLSIQTAGPYTIANVIARKWYDDGLWDLVNNGEHLDMMAA